MRLAAYCAPEDAQALTSLTDFVPVEVVPRDAWPDGSKASDPAWWLQYEQDRLALHRLGERGGAWVAPGEVHRRAQRSALLARACGLRGSRGLHVLDAMGGWGVDALTLLELGARVTCCERLPAMVALVADLARRGAWHDLALRCADFRQLFDGTGPPPGPFDVIYLDPLFPSRGKAAAPGKRMQFLAALARDVGDGVEPAAPILAGWLEALAPHAARRLVLKRRRLDPPVLPPHWEVRGKSVRYDVYDTQRLRRALTRAAPPARSADR